MQEKNNSHWMRGQDLRTNDHWALTAPFSCQPDTVLLLVVKARILTQFSAVPLYFCMTFKLNGVIT